ncbi:hypothetical protein WJX72_000908 [[Myrmecia] bisecta]|uniref:Uncharacterized protein n=1 Tax=[Myrmecia] bisecta TaxID=41462 RepID=A0AAW1QP41_9CHLO
MAGLGRDESQPADVTQAEQVASSDMAQDAVLSQALGPAGAELAHQGLRQLCTPDPGDSILRRQHLFSVYIHPMPDYGDIPGDSMFHGREIKKRIQVEWGSHQLIDATRNLLHVALADPLNQKFILMSESHVPLYPPQLVYQQLISEDKSRMDSWGLGNTDLRRWTPYLAFGGGGFNRGFWRKSSQWFSLRRDHAQATVDDTFLSDRFARYCKAGFDEALHRFRDCYSDEHYIPSLLAYLQRGHETDGLGYLVHVDWSHGGAHPKSYLPEEVQPNRVHAMRGTEGPCEQHDLDVQTVGQLFIKPDATTQLICEAPAPTYNHTLTSHCPLFARKFPKDTVAAVFDLLRSCDHDLAIVNNGTCEGQASRSLLHDESNPLLMPLF